MNKKITALSTTILLGLGTVFVAPSVKAANIQDGISKANVQISQYEQQLKKLNDQVARVDKAISDNNNMIADTERKITESNNEVQQLQQQIATINDRIAKRNIILKKRAQAIQESGGNASYIDVLLGASSFQDFIDRVGAVATIVQADLDLAKEAQADKQVVEQKEKAVEKKLEDLRNMKTDLEGMKEQILEQKSQNDALKADLKDKQKASIAERAALVQQQQQQQLQQQQQQQEQQQQQQQQDTVSAPVKEKTVAKENKPSSGTINLSLSAPKTNGSINDIITAGYKYIGNSVYVFGGGRSASDVAHGRFDCSGFVHWAFSQGGYNVGSSTDSLVGAGTSVSTSEMQPGDLVFFNTYKTNGHVGIYLGGGKFIGSQSSTGVAIADLTSGYWKAHFNGRVVRIVN
jgi:peptidoglycan DL-endopeptidase CwlO